MLVQNLHVMLGLLEMERTRATSNVVVDDELSNIINKETSYA
jgi:hypothetical protein